MASATTRSEFVTFRARPEEKAVLMAGARAQGLELSEAARRVLLRWAARSIVPEDQGAEISVERGA